MNLIIELPGIATAGIFGLMDRSVVDASGEISERNRFIPGLRSWLGFSQTSVFYQRQQRASGDPKQSLTRLIRYALDAIISFSNKPLRVATWAGLVVSTLAFLLAVGYFAACSCKRFLLHAVLRPFSSLYSFSAGCIWSAWEYLANILAASTRKLSTAPSTSLAGPSASAENRGRIRLSRTNGFRTRLVKNRTSQKYK